MKQLKKYGQHFLQNAGFAARIAAAVGAGPGGSVIEVGPGSGVLTAHLAESGCNKLQLVEIDPRWAAHLRERFGRQPAVEVLNADFLAYDFREHWGAPAAQVRVAGNIPYYITSPILFKLLENRGYITRAVLMVQKEVADRLTAECGTKDYGIPTVFLAAAGHVRRLFDIGREEFRPVPGVDSSAVQIDFDRSTGDIADYGLFVRLVRGTFQTRRKKIRNSLGRITGPDIAARVRSVDLDSRPEELSPDRFKALANEIHQLTS